MRKALVILHKEWLELRGERTLLMTVIVPPLLLTILPIVALYLIGSTPDEDTSQLGAVIADPSFAGLSEPEVGQALMGKQFGLMFLIMPLLVPATIASYSIVGEKNAPHARAAPCCAGAHLGTAPGEMPGIPHSVADHHLGRSDGLCSGAAADRPQ